MERVKLQLSLPSDGASLWPSEVPAIAATIRAGRWLPVSVTFDRRVISVAWLEFGPTRLNEPFFSQTVRALRRASPPRSERVTDCDVLKAVATQLASVKPSGVIFHISRCGSTVIANALRAGGAVVLSEAQPVDVMFMRGIFAQSPLPRHTWDVERQQLANALVTVYGHVAASDNTVSPLVIKCQAASILRMDIVRAIWPETPFIIVIRDPCEVIVSNIAGHSGWVRARSAPLARRTPFGWSTYEAQNMSIEEYCARGLGEFFASASRALDQRCRVLEYSTINDTRLRQVGQFFGTCLDTIEPSAMRELLSVYSKDTTGARAFADDSESKRKAATASITAAVERWARQPYEQLKAHASW